MEPQEPSEWGPAYDAAVLLLALVVEGYAAVEIDLPERQYITPGIIPAFDEDQLTVSVQAIRTGIPGQRLGAPLVNCGAVRHVSLRIDLTRCTPVVEVSGAPPTAAALTESAKEILRDVELLDRIVRDGRLLLAGKGDPAKGRGIGIVLGSATPLGPDGGLSGSRIDVDVAL